MPVFQKNGKKILFIHIPKAGGTSVEHFFIQQGWKMDFFDGGGENSVNPFSLCSPQHMNIQQLRSIFRFDAFDAIFTLVRNPLDRIKSEYKWRVKYLGERRQFDEWFFHVFDAYAKNPFALDNHIRPQTDFVSDDVKYYKLEDGIGEALADIGSQIGVDFNDKSIPNAMESKNKNHTLELDEKLILNIINFYEKDYIKFDYEVG